MCKAASSRLGERLHYARRLAEDVRCRPTVMSERCVLPKSFNLCQNQICVDGPYETLRIVISLFKYASMAFSRDQRLVWLPRCTQHSATSANNRSTRFSQLPLVGVKCTS